MKASVNDAQYGEIIYEESIWGAKKLTVNGQLLSKADKKTFYMFGEDGAKTPVTVSGSYLFGVKVNIGAKVIQVVPTIKWYQLTFVILIFMFNLIWGNVPALVSIFPIVGGAIGGFFSALSAMMGMVLSRSTNKVWLQIVIMLAAWGISILICYLIALLILSAVA